MSKEKQIFKAIVSLYEDPYCLHGSKFPLSMSDTIKVVNLVRKHKYIINNYPDSIKKSLTIHAKSIAIKGIKQICNLPMHEALLIYNVITTYLK